MITIVNIEDWMGPTMDATREFSGLELVPLRSAGPIRPVKDGRPGIVPETYAGKPSKYGVSSISMMVEP